MTRISNSKLDLYQLCPRKFKFRYIEKVKGNFVSTPLLFGGAMDIALNYILQSIKDNTPWTFEEVTNLFIEQMDLWDREVPLNYFKSEIPENGNENDEAIHANLIERGLACLDVYINEVLPMIDQVLYVQEKGELLNTEGDIFEFIVDAIVKLKDGRVVLLDNKTSSSKYPKNKVIKSQQLSLYLEAYPDIKYAGYAVVIKNPDRTKGTTFQFMVDEIPESTKADSFKLLEDTLLNIKQGKFGCNYKSCKAFGKECEYARACQYGDYYGLVDAYAKKRKRRK